MKNLVVLDCEVYPNYFLASFKSLESGKLVNIESYGEDSKLTDEDQKRLFRIMKNNTTFGFNSYNYDLPIIHYALKGKSCNEIYKMSKDIVEKQLKQWQSLMNFGIRLYKFDHFDIKDPAPGVMVSLKLYGGRMNSVKLQDLPYGPHKSVTVKEALNLKSYCENDLDTTIDLYKNIDDRIKLRSDLNKVYGIDLRSKGDAMIAEAVFKSALSKMPSIPKSQLKMRTIPSGTRYKYEIPEFIEFTTDKCNEIFNIVKESEFTLDGKGSIKLPEKLSKTKHKIGYSTYKFGVGGIHSNEKAQTMESCEDYTLIDVDVASYYPAIILNLGLYPEELTSQFLTIYSKIVETRLKAKRENDKITNESLKIVINGSFGKFGNKYSILYSPKLLMTVTITGQLSLLMLIERLERSGVSVVSANTDGIVSKVHKSKIKKFQQICNQWQKDTGFDLEETRYKALYSRDVNNYLAVKEDGKMKGKGIFSEDLLGKNPQAVICIESVRKFISDGIPIRRTIKNCNDITKFLTVRTVNGGAEWNNQYLGRVVRWVYTDSGQAIHYVKNGNKVALSQSCQPIMELNPSDIQNALNVIDYNAYITIAEDILDKIGYTQI